MAEARRASASERGASATPRERMERGYAKAEERNQEAREALEPLAEGERPLWSRSAPSLAGLIALSIVVGYLAGVEVDGEKPRARPGRSPRR